MGRGEQNSRERDSELPTASERFSSPLGTEWTTECKGRLRQERQEWQFGPFTEVF